MVADAFWMNVLTRRAHPVRKRLVDVVESRAPSCEDIHPSLAKMMAHAKFRKAWM
jgi:hypothetical protein